MLTTGLIRLHDSKVAREFRQRLQVLGMQVASARMTPTNATVSAERSVTPNIRSALSFKVMSVTL